MQVMYFSAQWCVPCKILRPIVESVSRDMGVNISYIDADQNQPACQSFGINSVPTIIIINNNNEVVFRKSGVMSKEEFSNALNKFK